jgi:diguanylate cyclase (GGDEF)-like protein/PAS domain S-box-containing protein
MMPGSPSSNAIKRGSMTEAESFEYTRLLASVFYNTGHGVFITDRDGTVLEVNRAFTEILGYERDEVIGMNPRLWQSGRHSDDYYRSLWTTLLETGHWRGEIWNRRKNGEIFPQLQTISAILDGDGVATHFTAVFSDISEIKQAQAQLETLAHRDTLTGLANRLLFNERLEQAVLRNDRRNQCMAVMFLDVDNFKHINDSLGHSAGDTLMQELAQRLVGAMRKCDTVARIGGDEFALLLDEVDGPEGATVMARKIMSILSLSLRLEGREIRTTASLGISLYPFDGHDAETLLRNADAAMYRAKDQGRNGFCFYTRDMTNAAFERMLLEHNLREALDRDEFYLVYQPQLDLSSGRVIGAEALIRWEHPEMGMVPPGRFIPVAEHSELIHRIGNWVLRTACRQAREWLDRGLEFGRIAVNLGGPQVQRGRLVEEVEMALSESGLDASRLELEVTETFVMQRIDDVIDQLEELRRIGVTLAIDDFGTGYSSLRYLKELPIHKLKIDRSFVADVPRDDNDAAIVETIIAMGKSLQLVTVAEGVERRDQAAFLHGLQCREVQGYLFSHPLDVDEFRDLVRGQTDSSLTEFVAWMCG